MLSIPIYHEDACALTCPRCALFVSILPWKTFKHTKTSRDVTPWWRHTMWCLMSLQWIYIGQPIRSLKNLFFLSHADLDLWPWPSNSSEILARYMPPPNFRSVRQMVQRGERWQTETHRRFFTLDRWCGREMLCCDRALGYTIVEMSTVIFHNQWTHSSRCPLRQCVSQAWVFETY